MAGFRLRYLIPVALISLCLVVLCAVTAASLFAQQAAVTRILRENVDSRRAAVELEECLTDLIALEDDRVESVAVLHARVRTHLVHLRGVTDQPEEERLLAQMARAFADYIKRWDALPPLGQPGHDSTRRAVTRYLENEVLRPCERFKLYNAGRIESSTENHERTLRQLAWGMAGVGGMGAVAGVVFGYGFARGLSRSIRRLRVQLRDVAGKLDPAAAEIVITEQGDFRDLHAEADRLTERVERMVQELQQREHEVLRAEQLAAVGQLAAGVAHEIRNPLTAIKMLVQATQEARDGLTAEDLAVIEAEIRRVEHSLQTFLDFARPPKAERRSTELVAVVRRVFDLLRPRADKQRVTLVLNADQDVMLTADEGQLRQVLVNLALNALDAMPHGGTLTTTVQRTKGAAELEVADTGPGVSKAMLPRLFEPFASGKDTGLGLGLVISKRIVEDHGGTIGAANRVGGGASFFVRLPVGGGYADVTDR
jgi:signal transduction histidine kinase